MFRLPCFIVLILSVAVYSSSTNSQPVIEDALLDAAVSIMPSELTETEIRELLEAGVWNEGSFAVALSMPRVNEYLTFVFRLQPDGSYSAQDVSWIANTVFGVWGYPRSEIERFETNPLRWGAGSREDVILLWAQTRGWREGQRYTGTDVYMVLPDGTLENR
jgi:hypothetical protein